MPASPESVLSNPTWPHPDRQIVAVCAPSWVGDCIMSMPALQTLLRLHPDFYVILVTKPGVAPLWEMHTVPQELCILSPGISGIWLAGPRLRERRVKKVWILPNSFRAAFVAWLARIPERYGFRGHFRSALLTHVATPPSDPLRTHQAWEYMALLCPEYSGNELEMPQITIPQSATAKVQQWLKDTRRPLVVFLPGTARGPAKQWPAKHFVALGRRLVNDANADVALAGAPSEQTLCEDIARQIGPHAVNFAGWTSLQEWAALLRAADVVVCNDSGGMHLAAAVGVPIVALFGLTDPSKTGPLTPPERQIILQSSPTRSRDVPRHSEEATKWLASISPEEVYESVLKMFGQVAGDKFR